jgi:hypothetical protein
LMHGIFTDVWITDPHVSHPMSDRCVLDDPLSKKLRFHD